MLPKGLEAWLEDPSLNKRFKITNLKVFIDPQTLADKITYSVVDVETGETLLENVSLVGVAPLIRNESDLQRFIMEDARRRLGALIEQERRRREYEAIASALSAVPSEMEVEFSLTPPPPEESGGTAGSEASETEASSSETS